MDEQDPYNAGTQRDTIEYGDMDIPEMEAYIKHTVDQNEAYPAGLYVWP